MSRGSHWVSQRFFSASLTSTAISYSCLGKLHQVGLSNCVKKRFAHSILSVSLLKLIALLIRALEATNAWFPTHCQHLLTDCLAAWGTPGRWAELFSCVWVLFQISSAPWPALCPLQTNGLGKPRTPSPLLTPSPSCSAWSWPSFLHRTKPCVETCWEASPLQLLSTLKHTGKLHYWNSSPPPLNFWTRWRTAQISWCWLTGDTSNLGVKILCKLRGCKGNVHLGAASLCPGKQF